MNAFKYMPAKTTPKAGETGKRILDSALELFREKGFDATTMRDIAVPKKTAAAPAGN